MATWQSDYDEHIKNNTAATQKKITERQTANTNMSNQYVADVNAIVDQSTENAVNKVQNEIDKLPTQYQSGYDANAIQQKINERQVAERMANLGLTDSGLNRTQQTAINIQRSNADAALTQQKNAATASLRQQIADLYSSAETQKMQTAADARYQLAQTNQNVYNTYMDNLESSAVTYANNEATNRANIEKAKIEAAQKQQEKFTEWALENGYTYDANGNLVASSDSATSYDNNSYREATKEIYLKVLAKYISLGAGAMTEKNEEEFLDYLDDNFYQYDRKALLQYAQNYKNFGGEGSGGSDGGNNWGSFWGLFDSIDGNASVDDGMGNQITMDELYDALIKANITPEKAKEYVVAYQKYKGLTKY